MQMISCPITPPLSSVACQRKGAVWPVQVALPGFSSPLIGQECTLQTRVTSSWETACALCHCGLFHCVEDNTAGALSSPTLWPCNCRQAGGRLPKCLWICVGGWFMIYVYTHMYVCVCIYVYICVCDNLFFFFFNVEKVCGGGETDLC